MDVDFNLKIFSHKWKVSISKQWLQFSIVTITVLVSTLVAYWGSRRILLFIPALLGGIAILLVLLRQINVGFILILLTGMFVPFAGPGGINASVLMVAVLLTLWLMNMLVVKRHFYFIRSRVFLPVVLLIVISVIAFGMGQLPWFPFANQAPLDAQLGGFAIFILSLGLLLATAHLVKDIKWLEVIVWVFLGFGVLFVIGKALNLPVDLLYQQGFRGGSMFWTWLVAISFSQFVFNNKLRRSFRSLLLIVILITFYVAMVRQYSWKSGWLPPFVVVAVILGLRYPRLFIVFIPVAIIITVYLALDLIASDEYSWSTRIDAWRIVLDISRESPLFGLGFSNYYWYTPLFPIRGWYVNFNSHSQFVDLIAQVGILGLICFIWIFFEVGKLSWRILTQLSDGFARSYAYGVLAGAVGTLMAAFLVDWVLPFVYNIGLNGFRASILPWIFFGGLVSIQQIYLENQNTYSEGIRERSSQNEYRRVD